MSVGNGLSSNEFVVISSWLAIVVVLTAATGFSAIQ